MNEKYQRLERFVLYNSERLVGYDNSERLVGYDNSERLVGYDNSKKPKKPINRNSGRKAFDGHFIQTRKYSWVIHIKNKHLNYYKSFCFKKYTLADVKKKRNELIYKFN